MTKEEYKDQKKHLEELTTKLQEDFIESNAKYSIGTKVKVVSGGREGVITKRSFGLSSLQICYYLDEDLDSYWEFQLQEVIPT